MADTFSQISIHIVFAVKKREALINHTWENRLYRYITGIVQERKHKMLAINGMPDHIHIFIGMDPAESLSSLVREVKKASTRYINQKGFVPGKFAWQTGYGAFSYSRSQRPRVCRYIENQKQHHRKRNFEQEYRKMLDDYDIEIGRKEVFDFFRPDDA